MMWKWLVAVAVIAGGCFLFFSDSRKFEEVNETADTLTIQKGDLKVVYVKKQSSEWNYMVFGVAPISGDPFFDSFIAGIPLETAKTLLQQYPDMNKCGSPGSKQTQDAVRHIFTVYQSTEVTHVLKEAKEKYDKAITAGDVRFCLKVQGRELEMKDVFHGDNRVDTNTQIDGKPVSVKSLEITSCP